MRNTSRLIKDLPLADRPREKLLSRSSKNLSEAELVAILLGTGTRGKSAVKLGETILKQYPKGKLFDASLSDLILIPGVGRSKAARIVAAMELGERFFAPASMTKVVIKTVHDVMQHVRDIVEKRQEYLFVLYLNARHELIQKEIVAQGALNALKISPREIFAPAFQSPCASIIIVHNHPSGDPAPSDDDINFTERIHEAGEMLGIPLVDHVIVSKSGHFSFRDNK
jgi:DNA repair protein RadC